MRDHPFNLQISNPLIDHPAALLFSGGQRGVPPKLEHGPWQGRFAMALVFLVQVCNIRILTNRKGRKISTLPQLQQVGRLNSEFPSRNGR